MTQARLLHQLAGLHGIQTAYYDAGHRRKSASHDSLMAVLRLLDAPVNTLADVPSAIREFQLAKWNELIEPVIIAWEGTAPSIEIRLQSDSDSLLSCRLKLETGEEREWERKVASLRTVESADVEGTRYTKKLLKLPARLTYGYHRLYISSGEKSAEALIICSPLKAYLPPSSQREWGVFMPLYAMRRNGWGYGSYSDLGEMSSWLSGTGGSVTGTLPFLPVFLDRPYDPSPYSPVSRLMWNEFYIDTSQAPGLQTCAAAKSLLGSAEFKKALREAGSSPLVNYRRLMALKRRVLEALSADFFSKDNSYRDELRQFVAGNSLVEDYARFRAAGEKHDGPWLSWPQSLKQSLKPGDYDEPAMRYHLYTQWLAHRQIESAARTACEKGGKLFLDLPLGSHPDGFDTYHWQDLFVKDCSVGAPPDAVFTGGQDWAFPPQHPEKRRKQGYHYYIECLRHHFRHAGILRIDHMMGFHRLYWIPRGMEASQGVYVRYPAEELYALLTLESNKHKVLVAGEDLGIVPPYVRPAMSRHGLCRTYVVQYELESNPKRAFRPIAKNAVASLNTHDMPTFAAYWQGLDLQQKLNSGASKDEIVQETARREKLKSAVISFLRSRGLEGNDIKDIMLAILDFLSGSRARAIIVNLEDLWQELEPQNVPGLIDERNWSRKARYTFKEFSKMPEVIEALERINKGRK